MAEKTDAAMWLADLRREFPRWGLLHVPWTSRWTAVRGEHFTIDAPNAYELREQLLALEGRG